MHKNKEKTYWQCFDCGLGFLERSAWLSASAAAKHYAQHENTPEDPAYVAFLERLLRPLRTILIERFGERNLAELKGLDFGCGPGPAIDKLLSGAGLDVKNYDPNFFPDEELLKSEYDFITCTEVAEHFTDPRSSFLTIKDLLGRKSPSARKPGGVLGLMTEILPQDKDFASWHYPIDPTHVAFYSKKTMNWLAQWLGWRVTLSNSRVTIFLV